MSKKKSEEDSVDKKGAQENSEVSKAENELSSGERERILSKIQILLFV
jgi:hypothetical protein